MAGRGTIDAVGTLSKQDSRRIGAELKRWSERPVRATNLRALGLCSFLLVMVLVAASQMPNSAAAVRHLAALFAVMLATLHFLLKGVLRGLRRAGVSEAQDALDSASDSRRISAFDMAMVWVLVALLARHFE